ncbi:XdhC family protein [Kribbella sp. VKM Ac-2568]|uniref:XdhC family protein n=1 Tax=Kribbella sp. VKM Ac-2568 TaxID=2512219 RepID=UPI0010534D15|nr:XdhC family protein [Kribbella sp. VKM Ac-2568]TCM44872.1 xanthine dehydrogenase accessory factor [Kribbella sp. VKM Ac-2568]
MTQRVASRVAELTGARVPFVHAVVVRAESPTSARPGDDAIVLADGSLEGFVGGVCTEGSVRSAALSALTDGQAVLLRILPEDATGFPDVPGARVVTNPCLSGGAVEIFLHPEIPAALVGVVGDTPIAEAIATVGAAAGFAIDRLDGKPPAPGTTAVVIAGLGRDELGPMRAALDAGVGYVGLVASGKRGEAVLAELGLSDEERSRVRTPVGLELGAETAGEIALSVLAELVRAIRVDNLHPTADVAPVAPVQVIDPVCGMTVVVTPETPHLVVDGVEYWFCGTGCRDAYAVQVAG